MARLYKKNLYLQVKESDNTIFIYFKKKFYTIDKYFIINYRIMLLKEYFPDKKFLPIYINLL